MKLHYQYPLLLGSLIVTAVRGTSLCVDFAERRFLQHIAAQRDQTTLSALVQIAKDALLADDDLLLIDYAQLLKQNHPDMAYVMIIAADGTILAHSDPQWLGQPATDHRVPSDIMVHQTAVSLGGQPAASVSFGIWEAVRTRDITQALSQARRWIWGIGGGMVSVALLAGLWLARSITWPIRRLEQAAEAIGQGQLDHRITLRRHDELGRLAQAFNAMAHRLGELNHLKEGFVQAVTHELRSPLGAISSFIHLMLSEARQTTEPLVCTWVGYLHRMQANTERLTRFINDVLDVAKLEEQKVACRLVPCELAPLINEVTDLFQPQANERQLTLMVKTPNPALAVLADPDHLRHIVTNLLSNALKFTPPGGTITIHTTTDPTPSPVHRPRASEASRGGGGGEGQTKDVPSPLGVGGGRSSGPPTGMAVRGGARNEGGGEGEEPSHWVHISVADTGIGIPKEAQGIIFDKFQQVPGSRTHVKGPKGTGLGLTIAKTLVELQGGHIWVDSTPGQGSRFTITLRAHTRFSPTPLGTPHTTVPPKEATSYASSLDD